MKSVFVAAVCVFTVVGAAAAQVPSRTERFAGDSAVTSSTTGIAFVASAVLPGAGQFYLKSERWVPFIAVEAWAWVKYIDNHRRGRRLETEYRDLAWNVARRITTTTRRDSVFTYYEAIKEHDSSGLFDADPVTAGLQPEENEATFNGIQWHRAKALFLRGIPATPGTSEYEQALAYYRTNAIPEGYTWSWGRSLLEQRAFAETISRSDAAFRDATTMMGVILANHIVSAVDALVQGRVKMLNEHRIRIGSTVEPVGSSYFWTMTVQIPLPGADRVGDSREDR